MNDSLLMLQLVFNLVMLVAIILISRSPQPVAARRARSAAPRAKAAVKPSGPAVPARPTWRERLRHRRARASAARAAASEAPRGPSGAPPHLEALLESTERTELVAEQVLRERLARLGAAAAGGR